MAIRLDKHFPFWLILVIEVFWIIFFFALVIRFQVYDDGESLRVDLILSALHAGAPYVAISALEHDVLPWAPFFWALFAVFTDTWSVLNAFLHATSPNAAYLQCLEALTVMAMILSGLTTLWYGIVLARQYMVSKKHTKGLRDYMEDETEPLVPLPLKRQLRGKR